MFSLIDFLKPFFLQAAFEYLIAVECPQNVVCKKNKIFIMDSILDLFVE